MSNKLTEKALATIIVIAEMGDGIPTYLFGQHDFIDAMAAGFVENRDESLYLTPAGKKLLDEIATTGEVTIETELSTDVKKVLQ